MSRQCADQQAYNALADCRDACDDLMASLATARDVYDRNAAKHSADQLEALYQRAKRISAAVDKVYKAEENRDDPA